MKRAGSLAPARLNMDRLSPILARVRQKYLAELEQFSSEHTAGPLIAEPFLGTSDGEIAREGALALGLRVDFAACQDGRTETISIDSASVHGFEPFAVSISGVDVDVSPFTWDNLELRIEGVEPGALQATVRAWAVEWFREDDPGENSDLHDCIHFLADPENHADGTRLTIDLGSARVEALLELIDRIGQQSAHLYLCAPQASEPC